MRQIKHIFIYALVLAFIYIGAGIPISNYCCLQKKEMKTSCCNEKHDSCCKTKILKVDNFEKASASVSVAPVLHLVAEAFSPYTYQQTLPETILRDDNGYPPGSGSSRHYLSLFCVLLI